MKNAFLVGVLCGTFVSMAGATDQIQAQTTKQKMSKPIETSRARLQKVRVLYGKSWRGDAGFARRLQRELSEIGFVWTRDAKRADAFVEADTNWTHGGFRGELWLRDRNGKLLWHEIAFRPRNSNRMASTSLASKLRAARQVR